MTHDPDDQQPSDEAARKLDEDAAWREIVENFGERATLDDVPDLPEAPADPAPEPPERTDEGPRFPSLARRWEDPLESEATWDDEGHFVPPEPPPLPRPEPRRRLAWGGLFGAPLVMLLAVVFGWHYPTWFTGLLVAAFVGGFVYLVATMPRRRHDDPWGDDGAVV